ncbi:MAG TPA: two-component regulator propeller domain-containing protein, partial [Puia sp.]|nr:two-component regulator propeller domain-containing protein [Puia sp.]
MNRARPLSPSGWLTSGIRLLALIAGLLPLALTCPAQLLPIRNYTIKEGLSSNNIYAVLRDTRGILWVGTNNGVSCYDGDRFFQPPMDTRTGQIYVTNFFEDHEHNIWVTSWYNGLYRYKDGGFVNYLPDIAHLEAQANNTFDMVEWSPGRYIVATDKNVWLFDDPASGPDNGSSPRPMPPSPHPLTPAQPRFHLLDPSNHSLEQQIGTVVLTPGGELLIGYGKGLAHYHLTDSAAGLPHSPDGPSPDSPSQSRNSSSPSPGSASDRRGLPPPSNGKKWVYAGMLWEGPYVNRIALLEDQAWLASDSGLYYFPHFSDLLRDPSHTKPMLLYPASPPHSGNAAANIEVDRVYVDTEKNIWFTGGGGAHKIPAGSYQHLASGPASSAARPSDSPSPRPHVLPASVPPLAFRTYSRANGLPSDAIRTIYSDPEGITWIGTEDGLARLLQEYYRFYPIQDKFRDALGQNEPAVIISIHDDRQGNLWMGSYDGLYQVKKNLPKTAPMPEITSLGKKKVGFVNCMIHDKQGRLWACTDGGILSIDGDTPVIRDFIIACCAFVDPDGRMWFGSNKGRVAYYQDGHLHLLKFTSSNDERIDGIYHDPKGFLWLGYSLTGLRKFRIQGDSLQHVLEYTEHTGYANMRVRSLSADGKGHLLVGTRTDGLYIIPIDGDSSTRPVHITTSQGLSGNWVKASLAGTDGCYLATNNGLDLLEPVRDYQQVRIHPIPFRNEQVPVELNTLFLQSDTLWLGTAKGLLQYVLHQQGKNTVPPPVCFMKLTINGRPDSSFQPFTQTSELPHLDYEQNNLAFDFAGLSFRDEDKVSYRYKMEGLDKDWSAPTSRRYVNYSHLSPGSYRLLVMAGNDDGVWSKTPAALS